MSASTWEITVTRLATGRFLLHMYRSVGYGWTEQWSKRCKTLRQAQAETEIRLGTDVRRVQICRGSVGTQGRLMPRSLPLKRRYPLHPIDREAYFARYFAWAEAALIAELLVCQAELDSRGGGSQ